MKLSMSHVMLAEHRRRYPPGAMQNTIPGTDRTTTAFPPVCTVIIVTKTITPIARMRTSIQAMLVNEWMTTIRQSLIPNVRKPLGSYILDAYENS